MIYTLDTNIVIDALRQPAELDRLRTFLSWALPSTVLSSVVVAELAAGARTDRARAALDEAFVAPFARRGRLLAPSAYAFQRTGLVLARTGASNVSASRFNDILLAAQARERGWTLVTRDDDFRALRLQIGGLKVAPPFPERP